MHCKSALRWRPQNPSNEKSALVQVMAWCRQATSHYLSQCWPRSVAIWSDTRPQWVEYMSVNWLRDWCWNVWLTHLRLQQSSCSCYVKSFLTIWKSLLDSLFIDGLAWGCGISTALAREIQQSCGNIEVWTQWQTFCRQHFPMNFLEWKIFMKFVP